ncbi:MAG TPA: hypothetical protein VEM14_08970, partial [Gemmatimonadaceae bacterium]|nr:hypothetical protein [Gemmatimonadaceae bacterium]
DRRARPLCHDQSRAAWHQYLSPSQSRPAEGTMLDRALRVQCIEAANQCRVCGSEFSSSYFR